MVKMHTKKKNNISNYYCNDNVIGCEETLINFPHIF